MPLIWLPWAAPPHRALFPAARKSGWRGPEDAVVSAMAAAGSGAGGHEDAAAEWETLARKRSKARQQTPHVDSPSISGRLAAKALHRAVVARDIGGGAMMGAGPLTSSIRNAPGVFSRLLRLPAFPPISGKPAVSLPHMACAAMGALAAWR